MIEPLFYNLVTISFTTSLVILLLLILSNVTTKYYFAKWNYWAWLIIMIRLALPFNISFADTPFTIQVPTREISLPTNNTNGIASSKDLAKTRIINQRDERMITSSKRRTISYVQVAIMIWASGAVINLLYHVIAYLYFVIKVKGKVKIIKSEKELEIYHRVASKMYIHHKPILCQHPNITSPMLLGFMNPIILLPVQEYDEIEFLMIIQHEVVHFKRKDIWYKLLIVLVQSIHWFNPIIHIASKQMENDLEISCDEEILKNKSLNFRKEYGEIMLNVMRKNLKRQTALSTHFSPNKKTIKQRFIRIIDTRRKYKGTLAFCFIIFLVGTLGTLVACQSKIDDKAIKVETDVDSSNSSSALPSTQTPEPAKPLDSTESEASITPVFNNYSNKFIQFDYPGRWLLNENSTEDISYVSFYDVNSESEPVFWYSMGEAGLTDLKRTEKDYETLLLESYPDIVVTALTKTSIGGFDAIKLMFTYTKDDVKYVMIQYETIVGFASFHFNGTYELSISDAYESEVDAIISSITFSQDNKSIKK